MFNAEVNRALTAAADLINTAAGLKSAKTTPDTLDSVEGLKSYLADREPELEWPTSKANRKQLEKVRQLREQLHTVWKSAPITEPAQLALANSLLEGVGTRLVAVEEGETAFRERPIPVSDQVNDVMTATVAAALAHLVTHEETGRLRICRGDDCEAAIVDLTRNRSKLFCDFGNCANRAHVRAYRARQAAKKSSREDYDAAGSPGKSARRLTKPSAAEKADQLNRPTSASAIAAKEFRDRMRAELMGKRQKKKSKEKS
ncbi:CGNR zinc finger domain-containing protein [Nesterenkonia ebinurensis]|uniref:CGNR zinc finger domain-containing protein n=1 Tax=Nesterenkonia ebinurensis TaxID=2608252 RepID=UPI00168B151D|nr:CGNR zinc finger domain-containing protein [Nesterenkonia ebinurensis]